MITFTVTPDTGDPFTFTAGTRDVYTWEKTSKGKTLGHLEETRSMVDLYEIAYIAARRQSLFTGTLKDFTDTCDLEAVDEEEPAPFPPAQSQENSSPSPSPQASRRASGQPKANKR